MRPAIVALLLVAALVSGCASSPQDSQAQDEPRPAAFDDVQATSSTGLIRGLVVSEAIVPIPDALVRLADGRNQTTDSEGAFVFTDLEPGDYFLSTSKLGYNVIQQSVTVVAGVSDPTITKIMLTLDAAAQPYVEVLPWSAFLQCGAYIVAGSVNPCFLTGSDNVHTFEFGAGGRTPDYMLLEAVWDGTQPLGNNLWIMTLEGNGQTREANGPSNLFVNATKEQIQKAYGNDTTSISVRLFPGVAADGTPTVVTNQKYDIYVSFFYGFTPRADYLFALEGNCVPYDMCT